MTKLLQEHKTYKITPRNNTRKQHPHDHNLTAPLNDETTFDIHTHTQNKTLNETCKLKHNTMHRKNCEIHSYNTRSKNMFRISSGTQTFSNISARIWNSLMINLDIDVSLIKFKEPFE